jgi:hypothetical protein
MDVGVKWSQRVMVGAALFSAHERSFRRGIAEEESGEWWFELLIIQIAALPASSLWSVHRFTLLRLRSAQAFRSE